MYLESLFNISQPLAVIGWALILFIPNWKSSKYLVNRLIIPFLLAGLYAYLLLTNLFQSEGGFSSLDEIKLLFSNDALLLAGWVHYLAFDLMIGIWMKGHSKNAQIPHIWVVPCLLLTFMAGPLGVLLYMGIFGYLRKKWLTLEV
jgi:hypothetical protein